MYIYVYVYKRIYTYPGNNPMSSGTAARGLSTFNPDSQTRTARRLLVLGLSLEGRWASRGEADHRDGDLHRSRYPPHGVPRCSLSLFLSLTHTHTCTHTHTHTHAHTHSHANTYMHAHTQTHTHTHTHTHTNMHGGPKREQTSTF